MENEIIWDNYHKEDFLHAKLSSHKRQIEKSKMVISQFLDQCQNPYTACSGGKDSVAMLHLIQSISIDRGRLIPVMWHDSGVEWPGVPEVFERLKSMRFIDKLVIVKPDVDVIELKQAQSRGEISAKKKDELALFKPIRKMVKENGFDGVLLGLRQEESRGRKTNRAVNGLIYRTKEINKCTPIADWKWQDVYAYIAIHKLPLHPIYSAPLLHLEHRGRIRLSWWLSTDNQCHGELTWVRINFPEIYDMIINKIPEVSFFA